MCFIGTDCTIEYGYMHIGNRIKDVMRQRQRGVSWLAKNLPCDRTNVYDIFNRSHIDTELLQRISKLLEHDFFEELSKDTFQSIPHKNNY